MKSSMVNYCTQSIGNVGQYGIAVYMQASMFLGWKLVRDDLKAKEESAALSAQKLSCVNHWLANDAAYKNSFL